MLGQRVKIEHEKVGNEEKIRDYRNALKRIVPLLKRRREK